MHKSFAILPISQTVGGILDWRSIREPIVLCACLPPARSERARAAMDVPAVSA